MQRENNSYNSMRYNNIMVLREERAKRWQNAVNRKEKEAVLLEDLSERIVRRRNWAL